MEHRNDAEPPPLVPGTHYEMVPQASTSRCLPFPDIPELATMRHEWILTPHERPMVPSPSHTPMPDRSQESEARARLFSVYLRPWVLCHMWAIAAVPHLIHLDRIPKELAPTRQRLSEKTSLWNKDVRSFRLAWKHYLRGRVVSEYARRIITNASGACTAYGCRDDAEVPQAEDESRSAPKILGMALSLQHVHELVTESWSRPASEVTAENKVYRCATLELHAMDLFCIYSDGCVCVKDADSSMCSVSIRGVADDGICNRYRLMEHRSVGG